jgi:hypothetical protein
MDPRECFCHRCQWLEAFHARNKQLKECTECAPAIFCPRCDFFHERCEVLHEEMLSTVFYCCKDERTYQLNENTGLME